MAANDNVKAIEPSPMSGHVISDGIAVQVFIRPTTPGWSLEVLDRSGRSTSWGDVFASERDAYAEFERTVQTEGVGVFLGGSKKKR